MKKVVPEAAGKEQQLLRHARREGRIIMAVWLAALVWTVAVSYRFGYNRDGAPMSPQFVATSTVGLMGSPPGHGLIVLTSALVRSRAVKIDLVLGFPAWVFWGIVLPWGLCLAYTVWFCFVTMADDDLGQDPEEKAGHA